MAYINASTSKKIRTVLKEMYPEIKFSVRIADHMSLYVSIMSSPYFEDEQYAQINQYHIESHFEGVQKEVLLGIDKVIREVGQYYNNSDVQIDYFDYAFFYHIHIGRWDKKHQYKEYNLKLAL